MSVDVYVDNTVTTRIPRQLIESDTHGKGAAEIGWGSPGDWSRCKAFLRRHGVPSRMLDGACANLHKLATGEWPGPNAHKGAHALILDYLIAAGAPDTSNMIRWEGPLARIESPTGDRRQFPRDVLKYQSFPQPYRFQRQGFQGHQGAITVGVIENAAEADVDAAKAKDYNIEPGRYVWGNGYFLDPDIVPEVKETVHQIEHGVGGPSVDLDSFTAVLSKTLAGETVANMKRGRMRAATHVSVPAFADLRLKVMRPKELTAAAPSSVEFAVNSKGWQNAPIAPREALFDADDAAKRIEAWANGDPAKMASVFLWIADSPDAPLIGRRGYRLPWGDIIDGKPYLIFHAVYAAAALLQGAHGGLPAIPEDQKGQLRSVITSIYEKMADEFGDDSIVAPWDRVEQQQAAGAPCADGTADEYESYVSSFDAALEEFRRTHRYTERKHPRVPGKPGGRANKKVRNPKGGEWVDTPHGPHGQIKVGGKWVYPPKRGEKGYKDPEKAVKGIAERGGGKGPSKRAGTRVVKKARNPQKRAPAPAKKAAAPEVDEGNARRHLKSMTPMSRLERSEHLKGLKEHEVDNLVRYLGGTRHEDDDRGDMEIEILHQMEKDKGSGSVENERDRDVRRAKEAREISHGGGRKTIVARKQKETPPPKESRPAKEEKAPSLSERLTLRQVRDSGDEGLIKSKMAPGAKEQVDDLVERGLLERRGRGRYHITDKGRESLKGHESEEPGQGGLDKKAPPKKVAKTVVATKKGELKEHKLTGPQQSALERLREDEGAKVHPATRKVLEREGYLDSEGKLTDKGRDRLGIKETPKKEAPAKEPPKRVARTVVAKKTPRIKKTGEEHAAAIKDLKSRDEVEAYVKDLTGPELRDTLKAQNRKPEGRRVQELRDQIAGDWSVTKTIKKEQGEIESPKLTEEAKQAHVHEAVDELSGRDYPNGLIPLSDLRENLAKRGITDRDDQDRLLKNMDRSGELTLDTEPNQKALTKEQRDAALPLGGKSQHYVRARKAPGKSTFEPPKLGAKEKLEARKKENLDFLTSTSDEELVVARLTQMKRSELIAAYNDRGLNPISNGHDPKWSDDEMREQVLQLWKHRQRNIKMREDAQRRRVAAAERKVRLADYAERVKEADAEHREAVLQHRTENPLVLTGNTFGNWGDKVPEDTGPLGIPVKNLTIDSDWGGGYTVESGRLIKRNGVAYLIEDRDDTMADEMADFLEATHKELPGADRIMKGYAWLHRPSPNDAYWQKRFGDPDHQAAASSGDGIMRFWGPGNKEGLEAQRARAKHEYGHNVDNLIARRVGQNSGSDSERWHRRADRDREIPFPVGWQWDGVRKEPDKSKGAAHREVPYGVTDYGKSSWAEDYAESLDMYLRGPIGSAQQGIGKRVPVYFRDLFPHRAQLMDELFPDIGKRHKEEIDRRGPLTFL